MEKTCRDCKYFDQEPFSGQTYCELGICGVDSQEKICKSFKEIINN